MAVQAQNPTGRIATLVETVAFALMHGALAVLALVFAALVLGRLSGIAQ